MEFEISANKKNDNLPLVSVVTLVYNNFIYLFDTIDSILTQDYPNVELIVSDDAGSDFDMERITAYINGKHPDFKGRVVIRQNEYNMGTVRNANAAIAQADGKYIKLLTSGDMFNSPDSLSFLVKHMDENNYRISNSLSGVHDKNMSYLRRYYPSKKMLRKMGRMTAAEQYLTLTGYNAAGATGIIFAKNLFEEIEGFDEAYRLTEDWPTWLRITRMGIKIESVEFVSVKYRLGGVSGDGGKNPVLLSDFITMMEREILCQKELFDIRAWEDLQIKYHKALYWSGFSPRQKAAFLIKHCSYFVRQKILR